MWVQPQKAPQGHYESGGWLNLDNIAAAIMALKPVEMGGRVFPTKYQFELESLSGAYSPMKKALASEDTQARLSELTGLMTIEQYVKKSHDNSARKATKGGFYCQQKK
ncbi:hypothetical protein D5E71_14875 [Vibrio parahaemolyticus]|nr:hypothetical protein D5E71_14875 [Vibrio parahaemolyticus]